MQDFTPELLIHAYQNGVFPMARSFQSRDVDWIYPEKRGQLPILDLHIPRKLQKTIRKNPYDVRINTDFRATITACAKATPNRPSTWINASILEAFCALHAQGHAHSVECWQDDTLVGGLYGLALGQIFCGESMFSIAQEASKIALVHLVARLYAGGFQVLDTQFVNDHLTQFGVYEIPHEEYQTLLLAHRDKQADFILEGQSPQALLRAYLAFRAAETAGLPEHPLL